MKLQRIRTRDIAALVLKSDGGLIVVGFSPPDVIENGDPARLLV